ncbi:MAG: right-handed parallel beta-helix repeat-containing protein [Candidatus Heimdallarchaeaceae archaeon]|jgi:hypothetical protein
MVSLTTKALIKALAFILILGGLLAGAAILRMNNFFRPSSVERDSKIYISSSRDFRKIATSGDGTPENPYIIDSLEIITIEHYGMYIRNIEGLSVIIQNCTFFSISTNLCIESFFGDLIIRNNTFANGIEISYSSNISILNNSMIGFDIQDSWNIKISENYFYDGGFAIEGSEQIILTRNFFNGTGLFIWDTKDSLLTYNNFYQNSHPSAQYQLSLPSCNNITVFSNNFTFSLELALRVSGEYNLFYHNNFISNWMSLGPAGFDIPHVEDNGENNLFYSITLLEGNYWDNYNGTGYYYLLGDAGNYDPYPLNESVVF